MDFSGNIAITTFVNPHLFWIVQRNKERIEALRNIDRLMVNANKKEFSLNTSIEIGDFVAIEINHKLYRAIIEDEDESNNSQHRRTPYTCWLVDYGTMVMNISDIYKLPSSVRNIPPLAFQASLSNVAYCTEHLEFNRVGKPVKLNLAVGSPSRMSRSISMEIITKHNTLKFQFQMKEDGIFFGDILYKKDEENSFKSLTKYLIDKSVLIDAPEWFDEMKNFIHEFREKNIMLIADICSKSPFIGESEIDTTEYGNSFSENKKNVKTESKKHIRDLNSRNAPDHMIANELKQSKSSPKQGKYFESNQKQSKEGNIQVFQTEESDSSKTNSDSSSTKRRVLDSARIRPGGASYSIQPLSRHKKKTVSFATSSTTSTDGRESLQSDLRQTSLDSSGDLTSEDTEPIRPIQTKNQRIDFENESGRCDVEEHTSMSKLSKKQRNSDEYLSSTSSRSTSPGSNDNAQKMVVKPYCSCSQCEHWTHDTEWQQDNNFRENKKAKVKVCIHSAGLKLFKDGKDSDENITQIISLDYSSMTKIQKQIARKILIHCESLPTAAKEVSNVNFHQLVQQSLKELGYKVAKRMQLYTWPVLFRNQHVFMISGPRSGKSMAYLPVLCTFLLERHDRYNFHNKTTGAPIFIILCSNSQKCEEIYDLILVLLGKGKARISLITYPIAHINTSHIDLLVTTPLLLMDLMKSHAINMKRLCHFVLEDGHTILNRFKVVIDKIMDAIQSTLINRLDPKPIQLIICAEHWTKHLANIHKRLERVPLVCIGNFLEAALYGKVRFSIEFLNSACKEMKLNTLLKETHKLQKSVLVCKEEDIEDVEQFLMLKGIDATVIKKDMSKDDIELLENLWNTTQSGQHTVLVCTDFHLSTALSITNAALLVHYSLPSSWTKFVQRFCCMLENCRSPIANIEPAFVSQSVVLCDETCLDRMHKFFKYLHAIELKNQTDVWKECAKESQTIEENEKLSKKVGLCNNLKLFGNCEDLNCSWRHIVTKEVDFTEGLPYFGKIRFKILNLEDVTKYSIKIFELTDMNGKIHQFEHDACITKDLTESLEVKRRRVLNLVLGRWYAHKDTDQTFQRCELIGIDSENVEIKLIETGSVVAQPKSTLYCLPNEFNRVNRPREVLDIYLADLIPPYQDDNFSAKSFFKFKTMMEQNDYKNTIFTGEVHLQLEDTLWLKDVRAEIVLSDKVIPGYQLAREIVQMKLAVVCDQPLLALQNLCREANIDVPKYEKKITEKVVEKKIQPQWAHLDCDGVEEVFFFCAVSPHEFYVRLQKFYELGSTLQKEIQESLQRPNYPELKDIQEGTICLAKDTEEKEYERAIVMKIENDKCLVFFVDYGYDAVIATKDLKYIQSQFITKLPFQSIRCSLHGIKPVLNDWQNDSVDTLYEYAIEPQSDIFRTLFVKVCQKESCGVLNQNGYSVLLKDGFSNKNTLINALLIDCGFALPDDEPITDFEIPALKEESDESDEDLALVKDICNRTDELLENFHPTGGIQDSFDDMELFADDPLDFFQQVTCFKKPQLSNTERELPVIQAVPEVDYSTPNVTWFQKDDNVKMAVKLTDVKDYKLTLMKGRFLQFLTVKDQKTYKLNLILFDLVDLVSHIVLGPEIRITLKKVRNSEWPRLLSTTKRARNIHYNFETLVDEKERKFLEFPKDFDDPEPDDGVIDVMYNNLSDLDSDFDQDIEYDID